MEAFVARLIIKLSGALGFIYFVHLEIGSGVAELCYKVLAPCVVEAHIATSPKGFWAVVVIKIFMSMILLVSAINDIRRRYSDSTANMESTNG